MPSPPHTTRASTPSATHPRPGRRLVGVATREVAHGEAARRQPGARRTAAATRALARGVGLVRRAMPHGRAQPRPGQLPPAHPRDACARPRGGSRERSGRCTSRPGADGPGQPAVSASTPGPRRTRSRVRRATSARRARRAATWPWRQAWCARRRARRPTTGSGRPASTASRSHGCGLRRRTGAAAGGRGARVSRPSARQVTSPCRATPAGRTGRPRATGGRCRISRRPRSGPRGASPVRLERRRLVVVEAVELGRLRGAGAGRRCGR